MKVSNFKIDPAMFAPGDEVNISFTVKAESSDTIGEDGVMVWALIPGYGEISAYRDESFKISKGSTKNVSVKTVFSFGSRTFSRGDTISELGVQLGYGGSRVDVNFPLTILDARYKPAILMFAAERSNADGTLSDEGLALLSNIALAKSEQADTSVMSLRAYFKNETTPSEAIVALDLASLMGSALASEIQTIISDVVLKTNADYTVTLWFGDQYESASVAVLISRAFANMHLSGLPTGGVCFGGFSLSTAEKPLTESYYEGVFYNGIRGITNYSTEEVATGGTWIDGKPIYRRTFAISNGAANTHVTLGSISNFSQVVSIQGYVYHNDRYFSHSMYYNDTFFNRTCITPSGGVQVYCKASFSAVITVEYTKSTD